MRKILVIGSNSFAGSDFIDFLLKKNLKFSGFLEKGNKQRIFKI